MSDKYTKGDPYTNLAHAIIIRAAKDYRSALKQLEKDRANGNAMRKAMECERFFRSQWYEALTDVDGSYLIRKLREEAVG